MADAFNSWTATVASSLIVPANDDDRKQLVIQKVSGSTVWIGIGEAAVVNRGVALVNNGDSISLTQYQARRAIYAIVGSATGSGGYQEAS